MFIWIQMKMKINKIILSLFLLLSLTACQEKKVEPKPEEKPNDQVENVSPHQHETKFTLLEKEYTLPFLYEEIEKDGWASNTDLDEVLDPGKIIRNKFIRQGPYILRVSFYNKSTESLPLSKVWIAEIATENREFGGDIPSDLTLENGIHLNTPIKEALSHYKEYDKEESAVYETYTVKHDKSAKTTLIYDPKEDKIRWIELSDFHE